jgi:hypothetical protein
MAMTLETPPCWGPYSKSYAGISHIPQLERGIRFDFSAFPGLYRRDVFVPNVRYDTGYMPGASSADLSAYCFRHGMPDLERLYCDIHYAVVNAQSVLVTAEFVNRGAVVENAELHLMASVHFPKISPHHPAILYPAECELADGCIWIDALLDYCGIHETITDPLTHLPRSGRIRGEYCGNGFVDGHALGAGVLGKPGDCVRYAPQIARAIDSAALLIRYRNAGTATVILHSNLPGHPAIELPPAAEPASVVLHIGKIPSGHFAFELQSLAAADLQLDGFVIGPTEAVANVHFATRHWNPTPAIERSEHGLLLQYPDFPLSYGIEWGRQPLVVRQFLSQHLDHVMRETKHDHVSETLTGDRNGHFTNVFMRPLTIPANGKLRVRALLGCGEPEALRQRLNAFVEDDPVCDRVATAAATKYFRVASNPAGEPLLAGQQCMAATLLTNAVYPVRRRSRWIVHPTTGRWWDTLYTWDSGFNAIGLANIDPARSAALIATYLTDPDAPDHSAFVHYGTPVPTQFHAFHTLQQRLPDPQRIARYFPSFVNYHAYLAGRHGSSATARFRSGLLNTWDIFYNSGGWDDYPPQQFVHQHQLTATVAPVSTTAHAIRTARFLAAWAEQLNLPSAVFHDDIARLTEALQRVAWDAQSGLFSYVVHDATGQPLPGNDRFLRHSSGANFNAGLDGFMALAADACTPEQESLLIERLFDPARHWTPIGITTVDQSAPYFTADGYWNGAVWFPHQWLLWKALLDLGRPELAHRIAATALATWQSEVAASGRCFEHFIVQGGRGSGWHQFSGLSAPVLDWFAAYHRPATLTGGLNLCVEALSAAADASNLEARLRVIGQPRHAPALIAVLHHNRRYRVTFNDAELRATERCPGTLEFQLPEGNASGLLRIDSAPGSGG